MGTQWISSLYPGAVLLAIGPFLWGISLKKLKFNTYKEMLKNRRWFFATNIVLGVTLTVLVISNKVKFLWYVDLLTSNEFRPYDNYYPTLIVTLIMILGGVVGLIMTSIKEKAGHDKTAD